MCDKPIFLATHPRACSTAFERVFMTCRDTLQCVHEPFGDAFYFGPERLSARYEADEQGRAASGFHESTYQTVLDRLEREGAKGKRLFIKDIAHYLVPPNGKIASIVPSLSRLEYGVGTIETLTSYRPNGNVSASYPYHIDPVHPNPTVIPRAVLERFHFTFLIRHPRSSIPSYFRCTVPPLDKLTGFHKFMPSEAGYDEIRRIFDYLRLVKQIGPRIAGQAVDRTVNGINDTAKRNSNGIEICIVDADDLLDNPSGIIQAYCNTIGVEYHPDMLKWNSEEDKEQAQDAFKKWKGFHEDVINSTELKAKLHSKKIKSIKDEDSEWCREFGEKGAKIIRDSVDANIQDYEYLRQFALKV